jgi:hypothetical protein
MGLKEIGFEGMESFCLPQNRVQLKVLGKTGISLRFIKGGEVLVKLIAYYVRSEVFTVVTMNAVFWDIKPRASCRADVSEERSASIIRVTRIDELATTLVVTNSRRTLRRNTI